MAVFEYRGILVTSGKPTKGFRDAENAKVLRTSLRKDGILLTVANETKTASAKAGEKKGLFSSFGKSASAGDVAIMTRQLTTLIGAGIPLFESLSALIEQVEQEAIRHALTEIREKVREGTSFAKALEAHPGIFPDLYVNMVRAGEASGTLEQVLERLTTFMDSQAKLRSKVTSALAYPVLMIIIGVSLISVLMVAVVPNVVSIFQSMNEALPWYTSLLITVSDIMGGYWWIIFPSLFVSAYVFRRWTKTPTGKLKWHAALLRMPVLGKLVQMLAVARFARTLATLLAAGVALLPAMDIVRNVLGNAVLEKVVVDAIGSIREGQSIAEPLKKSGKFPPLVTHMISVGEKSGKLEGMLESVADAYDAAVEGRVQMVTSLLEPLIIVFMGAGVAFIAMAILMPLIQMSSFAGG